MLQYLGQTALSPRVEYYWADEAAAVAEITHLDEERETVAIRATKSYRLCKQNAAGRENWDRNLGELNTYLARTFPSFRLSLDYVNDVSPEALDLETDVDELEVRAEKILAEQERLTDQQIQLEHLREKGLETFRPLVTDRYTAGTNRQAILDAELDQLVTQLEQHTRECDVWKTNGVMMAFLFSFSTDYEIVSATDVETAITSHLAELDAYHRRRVKRVLQGPKFKLVIEEVTEPRVLNQLLYTQLVNPETFDELLTAYPEFSEAISAARDEAVRQYSAFVLRDLELDGQTIERAKATPARAFRSILDQLDTVNIVDIEDIPTDGPRLGRVSGSDTPIGFDPAEYPHYYIVGATGSGKSYLKRVLLENCLAMGYQVLSLTPSDHEVLGAAFPNPNAESGRGLAGAYYWLGHDLLGNAPESITDLLDHQAAFIALDGLDEGSAHDFLNQLLVAILDRQKETTPLFLFLDEAYQFATGDVAAHLQRAIRETRKYGVHIVLSTQDPLDFSHTVKNIRQNTNVKLFLQGEYTDYAQDFLAHPNQITELDRGEVLIRGRDLPAMRVAVRQPVSQVAEPSQRDLETLDTRFQVAPPEPPALDTSASHSTARQREQAETGFTVEEQTVLNAIQKYIRAENQRPSLSKIRENSGFGAERTTRILETLIEKNAVAMEPGTRNGSPAHLYSVLDFIV